ncbi:MAG: hypothetical protein A2V87_07390 [Deltaproteobacteria bacterium RBG_16_58_17]|nr:MAG: hypothetical protein A2V87_07390 [Deltaproteobacteria bacterium RBG_16_58_17]OHE17648.1 MAG: hypothetical protein A2X96_04440 [Syntrophobacterales bacterium GWC2_56_13]
MTPTTESISAIDFSENPERFRFIAACSFCENEPAVDTARAVLTYGGGEDCDTPTFSSSKQEVEFIKTESFELLLKFGKSSFLRKHESSPFKTFWIPAYAGMTKWGYFQSSQTVLEGKLLMEASSASFTSFLINRSKGVQEGDTYGTIIEQDEIELLRSFVEGQAASRPVVVPLSREAEAFCGCQGIRQYVNVASDLINQCFSNIQNVESEILQDPDAEDQFLVIHLEVKGEIEAVLDMYDKYTEEWVSRVPWPERAKISLSYITI